MVPLPLLLEHKGFEDLVDGEFGVGQSCTCNYNVMSMIMHGNDVHCGEGQTWNMLKTKISMAKNQRFSRLWEKFFNTMLWMKAIYGNNKNDHIVK